MRGGTLSTFELASTMTMAPLHRLERSGSSLMPPVRQKKLKRMHPSAGKGRIRIRSSLSMLVALMVLSNTSPHKAEAFSAAGAPKSRSSRKRALISLSAKRPPISNFNLSQIEKFEHELETVFVDPTDDSDVTEHSNIDDQTTTDIRIYTISEDLDNKRLDTALAALEPSLSRSNFGSIVTEGNVRVKVNEQSQYSTMNRKSFKVESGMLVEVTHFYKEAPTEVVAQDLPLTILYEDEHMVVLNKAAGMVVHPAAGNWDGTVVNALAYYLSHESPYGSGDFVSCEGSVLSDYTSGVSVHEKDGETVSFRPGIVHRLDKGTTGVLVVAKTRTALAVLSESFASRKVKKTYIAITVGNPGKRVCIDKPIGRHPIHRQRMRVVPDPHRRNSSGMAPKDRILDPTSPSQSGRRALSFVDTLAFDGKLSLVQVRIETGRTHQIRVHLQDRRTPIYGDDVYGLSDWNKKLSMRHQIGRPLLHAYRLEVNHPVTGEEMIFCAPMADDMVRVSQNVWPEGPNERPDLFTPRSESAYRQQ